MRILISGYFGFNNTGDEAIFESTIIGFRKIDPTIKLVFLSKNPNQTKRQYFADAIPKNNILQIIFNLFLSDAFISGGGGLLQDKTSSRSLWYYLLLLRLAALMAKKTFVLAQGIGPVKSRLNKMLLKSVLKNCTLITVRDKASYDLLQSLGFKDTKIAQTADLTFLLSPQKKETAEINPAIKPIFGISIRKCAGFDSLSPKIARLADMLFEKYKAQIVFIPFQWPEDIIASNQVIRMMKNKPRLLGDAYKTTEILGLIGQMDFLLGMRLHSLIFAASSTVPAFGISYDPKVAHFMESVSLPFANVEDFDADAVFGKISDLLDNRIGVIKSLSFIKQELYAKSIDNFVLIGSLLKQ